MRTEKRIIAAITSIIFLAAALAACNQAGNHEAAQQNQQQPQVSPEMLTMRVPAHFTEPQPLASLRPTLPPGQFTSEEVRKAYQAAKDVPETLTQLPCFCHCDRSRGHKSLHSCYEDEHAADCAVCRDSAILAANLKRQGVSDKEIRDKLIALYSEPAMAH